MNKSRPAKKNLYLRTFAVAIVLTIAAGWMLTGFLGRVAEKEFREKVVREANLTVSLLKDNLDDVSNAAKSLSPAEAIVAALTTGSSADLERANRLLDRIKSSVEMSVCYLLDRNGLAVASSNRNEQNGFVGKSFANRPYFTGALAGRLTTYFALGLISRERGYYASIPVIGSAGIITGVVVIKRNIAPVEEFIKKNPNAFLVSPAGIIFVSSREEFLFRALWPVDETRRPELLASQQFGNITFEPLLTAEPRTGTYVRFDNEDHYLQRLPFGSDGWTLVTMETPAVVASYRLFGILLTSLFVLLLLFFFNVLLYKNRLLDTAGELLKSRDDWKRTFDTIPDLIAIIGDNHRIRSINRAMAERLGISRQEAAGRNCYELVHGTQEPPPFCPHLKMHESGNTEAATRFEKNLNGDFIVTASPILAADGTIESSVHVMHDVTEMKRLGEEVNRTGNLASIGLLAGGLAHDFNNVLSVIYGNISFAKLLAGGNSAVVAPLTDAEEACERAKELGIRLQAFSQGNSPVKELITLPAVLEAAAESLFKNSNVLHTISAAEDVLPAEADPGQIRQLFENILANAKDAISAGGTVTVKIENYLVDGKKGLPLMSGPCVRIAIIDNGRGIPGENLPKIFDPYFSTKDTYSQKGMGLGLSICHAILKRHNGHVSVESRVGIGTSVTVYLPACGAEVMHASS